MNDKKETCQGCPLMKRAEGSMKLFHCPVWNRLVSPKVTEACIYKNYDRKGGQQ